VIGGPLKAIS